MIKVCCCFIKSDSKSIQSQYRVFGENSDSESDPVSRRIYMHIESKSVI